MSPRTDKTLKSFGDESGGRVALPARISLLSIFRFAALWEDFDALGCERPEIVPRATRHIPEMVSLIEKLLETNHAYTSDGSVYYRIASFPEYGKLSKINFAGNIAGRSDRIDTDRYDKEDARDFAR